MLNTILPLTLDWPIQPSDNGAPPSNQEITEGMLVPMLADQPTTTNWALVPPANPTTGVYPVPSRVALKNRPRMDAFVA